MLSLFTIFWYVISFLLNTNKLMLYKKENNKFNNTIESSLQLQKDNNIVFDHNMNRSVNLAEINNRIKAILKIIALQEVSSLLILYYISLVNYLSFILHNFSFPLHISSYLPQLFST